MRCYVCISHDGIPYKLVWFNEDSKGVYVGLYGAVAGLHLSYHADGAKHFRQPGSPVPIQQHAGTRIEDIQAFEQVCFQAHPLSPSTLYIAGHIYTREDRASPVAVFLDGELFTGEVLGVDVYILRRTSELDFVGHLYSHYHSAPYRIVACNVFALEHFPAHKLAAVLLTGDGVLGG